MAAAPGISEETCRQIDRGIEEFRAARGQSEIVAILEKNAAECWAQIGGRRARIPADAFRQRPAAAVTPGTDPVCRPGENCYDLGAGGRQSQAPRAGEQSLKDKLKARSKRRAPAVSASPDAAVSEERAQERPARPHSGGAAKEQADVGPPPGYRREPMMDPQLCKRWEGTYHTLGTGMPVCDYPERSRFEGLSREASQPAPQFQRDFPGLLE